ncbi:PmoA family protein [Pontiella agarivorans]|uniref:PmoA family protein n=1 Tax=Pontiella agarivorans TaxID=3038953 RepID=A0ABU5MXB1_9BACT|nr:PmoA family protein [Pontiella agarivorans]MDZ8118768.1 PmoA family protein [Pontiella agarivorans]
MKKAVLLLFLSSIAVLGGVEIEEGPHSLSAKLGEEVLWTYHYDPAEGKPYFHPLSSTDGTPFTALRPKDHPWHRGLWFSWKFINGVNYWEEVWNTGVPREGYTRLLSTTKRISKSKAVQIDQVLDYAPGKDAAPIMTETRTISVSAPDAEGVYMVDWSCTFTALEKDVLLDRTPLPGEPDGKAHGGYAGLSVRMNKEVGARGEFVNRDGLKGMDTRRAAAAWEWFSVADGDTLLFMDHPDNLNHPAKWFVSTKMPYFSPAVIHDGPYTIKAGETLALKYRILIAPGALSAEAAEQFWQEWK